MQRRHHAITLEQASEESPVLARLAGLARESGARLQSLKALIPAPLHSQIAPGPIEGDTWCLLVNGNAAATKIRQLAPALVTHLQGQGCEINVIRVKIQSMAPAQFKQQPCPNL